MKADLERLEQLIIKSHMRQIKERNSFLFDLSFSGDWETINCRCRVTVPDGVTKDMVINALHMEHVNLKDADSPAGYHAYGRTPEILALHVAKKTGWEIEIEQPVTKLAFNFE